MAIKRDVTIVVKDDISKMSDVIYFYQHDRGIEMYFTVYHPKYQIDSSQPLTRGLTDAYSSLTILKPDKTKIETEKTPLLDGKVVFVINEDMTDEFIEIGKYQLQIHLYDEHDCRITIPPVQFDIKPLITTYFDGTTPIIDASRTEMSSVIYDRSIAVGDKYERNVWNKHDTITTDKMNNIENGIENLIEDFNYVPIKITSFTNNINTAEIGDKINEVCLSWTTNKLPYNLMLNDIKINSESKSEIIKEIITTNKVYTIIATDERGLSEVMSTYIKFINGVYYGVGNSDDVDNLFINGLTKVISEQKARSITVDAIGGNYIYYCVPSRYGECYFNVGGFDGGFEKIKKMTFANEKGYSESYDVYKSVNANLGRTTVTIY